MSYDRKDFITTKNLSKDQIDYILNQAMAFREINKRDVKKVPTLRGRTIVNLFYEASTRTRTSFEIAGKRLGADVINISSSSSSTTKGETLMDTVKNIEAMASDIVVIRHLHSGAVKFVADHVDAAIVNAGDGWNEHPTQAMLDLLTIKLHKNNQLEGLTVTIIGDIEHSRVARSDIWAMKTCGIRVKLFGPPTMIPESVEAFGIEVAPTMPEAIKDADVIIMLRIQRERMGKLLIPSEREYSKIFGLTPAVMKIAKKDVLVMHPGPINRGVELSSSVADSANSAILDQVENGVAVRMAVLSFLAVNLNKNGETHEHVAETL